MSASLAMLTVGRPAWVSLLQSDVGWCACHNLGLQYLSKRQWQCFSGNCAVAALSTHLSTAALDKHPQSKERGITLDLGFSSFLVNSDSTGMSMVMMVLRYRCDGVCRCGSVCQLHATPKLVASPLQAQLPEQLAAQPYDELQVTLVDCPGHASLIRTIIGGAQIIDMMLLVVDVTKGGVVGCKRGQARRDRSMR